MTIPVKYDLFKYTALLAAVVQLAAVSCTRDPYDADRLENNVHTVQFEVQFPAYQQVTTYAMQGQEDMYVRLLDLLIFDPVTREFVYSVSPYDITPDYYSMDGGYNTKKYQVDLIAQNGLDQAIFVAVANSRHYLSGIRKGDSFEQVMQSLVFDMPTDRKWPAESPNSEPFPMASQPQLLVHNGADLSTVTFNLTRALFTFSVSHQQRYYGYEDYISRILPSKIHIFNVNSRGYIVPPEYWDPAVTSPETNIYPPGNIYYRGPVSYDIYDGQTLVSSNGNSFYSTAFFPEYAYDEESPDQNFFIVIEAFYCEEGHQQHMFYTENGYYINYTPSEHSVRTFYKLEMIKQYVLNPEEPDHNKWEYYYEYGFPLVRNYSYNMILYDAYVPGYDTLEEAAAGVVFNRPENRDMFDSEIIIDDQGDNMLTDGVHYLAINGEDKKIVVPLEGQTVSVNSIRTNHPDGWQARVTNPEFEGWLSIEGDDFAGPNQVKELKIKVAPSDTVRVGSVYVHCGRFSQLIMVSQGADFPGEITNRQIPDFLEIPEDFNDNGNLPLVVYDLAPVEVDQYLSWYDICNIPYGSVRTEEPPLGEQHYPAVPNSCAALDLQGYHNWRLPTNKEVHAYTDYGYSKYLENTQWYWCHQWSSVANVAYYVSNTNTASELHTFQVQTTYADDLDNITRTNTPTLKTAAVTQTRVRCVRTVDEPLFLKTGTEMTFNTMWPERHIVAYVKDTHGGVVWEKGGSDFDDVVATVSGPTITPAEHGYTRYEWLLTPTSSDELLTTSIIVKSADGQHSYTVNLTLDNTYGYLIPASRTVLDYDILMAPEDQKWRQTWYVYANVPDGHNSEFFAPHGLQVDSDTGYNGSRPYSCASLAERDGGFWRLPSPNEWEAIDPYLREEATSISDLSLFGLTSSYYMTGASVRVYNYNTYYYHDLTAGATVAGSWGKSTTNDQYRARCIKAIGDFYSVDHHFDIGMAAETRQIHIVSTVGLGSYTKGPDFDKYFDMVFPSAPHKVLPDGTQLYYIEIAYKGHVTDLDYESTWIDIHSGTGKTTRTTMTIEPVNRKFTAAQTGLAYDLSMTLAMPIDYINPMPTWYEVANVPEGHNSADVPPAGVQVYNEDGPFGERARSCAAVRWGGYSDWRLPSFDELSAINLYLSTLTSQPGYLYEFGFYSSGNYIPTSSAYDTGANTYYQYYGINMYYANVSQVYYPSKAGTIYDYRCVRSDNALPLRDFFDEGPMTMTNYGSATDYSVNIVSRTALNPLSWSDPDGILVNPQLTLVESNYSLQKWRLTFSMQDYELAPVRTATFTITASDSRSETITVNQQNMYVIPSLGLRLYHQNQNLYENNQYVNWYVYANVPDGQESMDVPPAGLQESPPRERSCAVLGTDWRLPTQDEMTDILTYLNTTSPGFEQVMGLSSNTYYYFMTADPWINGSTNYPNYYMTVYYRDSNFYMYYYYTTKNSVNSNQIVRCVKDI